MYFEIDRAAGGWIWRIRGNNHEIMAVSEILETKAACAHAILVVKGSALNAGVWDRPAQQWVSV